MPRKRYEIIQEDHNEVETVLVTNLCKSKAIAQYVGMVHILTFTGHRHATGKVNDCSLYFQEVYNRETNENEREIHYLWLREIGDDDYTVNFGVIGTDKELS